MGRIRRPISPGGGWERGEEGREEEGGLNGARPEEQEGKEASRRLLSVMLKMFKAVSKTQVMRQQATTFEGLVWNVKRDLVAWDGIYKKKKNKHLCVSV